jgi:hypothetical protein
MAYLVDDILFFPVKGINFIAKKIFDMAKEEMLGEAGTKEELKELYELVEQGKISEEEFDEREEELVGRLEDIEEYKKVHR